MTASRPLAAFTAVALLAGGTAIYAAQSAESGDTTVARGPVAERAEVLALTNAERHKHGCRALRPVRGLDRVAQAHAVDMAQRGYFAHDTAGGRTWYHRIYASGGTGDVAENIGEGFDDAAAVVAAWMASPEHRANITNCHLHYTGIGYADRYWVQDFAQGARRR